MALADKSQHPTVRLHDVEVEITLSETIGELPGPRPNLDNTRSVRRHEPIHRGVRIGGTPLLVLLGPRSEGSGAYSASRIAHAVTLERIRRPQPRTATQHLSWRVLAFLQLHPQLSLGWKPFAFD
jgi:hypothetical protein